MLLGKTLRAAARALVISEKALRVNELKPHAQRPRRDFCSLQRVLFRAFDDGTWVPEDRDPTHPWNGLRELFQTLAD
jgi:hypothetical protein